MIEFAMDHHQITSDPDLDTILAVEQETYEKLERDFHA